MTERYTLTDEHRALLPAWTDKWIKIGLATGDYTPDELTALPGLIKAWYDSLAKPGASDHVRTVIAQDPISGAVAAAVAAGAIWLKEHRKIHKIGSWPKMPSDKDIAVATHDVLERFLPRIGCSRESLYTLYAECIADKKIMPTAGTPLSYVVDFLVETARRGRSMYVGGTETAGAECFFSFCRVIAKLQLKEFDTYIHHERLAVYGPRYKHKDFCVVTVRPLCIKMDDQHRPHCVNGPWRAWPNGSAQYAWHGQKIDAAWANDPASIDTNLAFTHPNSEVRRVLVEVLGWDKVLGDKKRKVIDRDPDPAIGTLFEMDLDDDAGKPARFLQVHDPAGSQLVSEDAVRFLTNGKQTNLIGRTFVLRMPPNTKSALEGQAALRRVNVADFIRPVIET